MHWSASYCLVFISRCWTSRHALQHHAIIHVIHAPWCCGFPWPRAPLRLFPLSLERTRPPSGGDLLILQTVITYYGILGVKRFRLNSIEQSRLFEKGPQRIHFFIFIYWIVFNRCLCCCISAATVYLWCLQPRTGAIASITVLDSRGRIFIFGTLCRISWHLVEQTWQKLNIILIHIKKYVFISV